jgi:hypothetical protein
VSIAGYRLSLQDGFLHLKGIPKIPFFIVIIMLTYSFSEERFSGVWLFKMHPLRALRKPPPPPQKKKTLLVEEERRRAVRRSHLLLTPVMFV